MAEGAGPTRTGFHMWIWGMNPMIWRQPGGAAGRLGGGAVAFRPFVLVSPSKNLRR